MKSVYFLPTNRRIKKCINSYIKEIIYAYENLGKNIPLVVVETNEYNFVKDNTKDIETLKLKYPQLEILHLTVDIQKKYFNILLKNERQKFKDVFLNQNTDYGNCMNKLFLITSSMGADALHRRDADTCLIFDEFNVEKKYPLEIELKYLGRKIKECNELKRKSLNFHLEDREIMVVGGNYFGEWNLDVKDFAEKSFDIIYKLYELLGFPKDSIKGICNEAFQFNKKYVPKEEYSLVTSVNDGLNPDCGNVAIYKLHEFFPNLPGKTILAADYFAFDTATALGIPSVHHCEPVFHKHKQKEFKLNEKEKYWNSVAKFADYFNSYISIYNNDLNSKYGITRKDVISENIIKDLIKEIKKFNVYSIKERTNMLDKIALEILIPFNSNYYKVGKYILNNSTSIINEINEEYLFHAELISRWKDLISTAKGINIRDLI